MGVVKIPTKWLPQPLGYGSVTETGSVNNIVDQSGDKIVDQLGNFIVTGTQVVKSQKTPALWGNTGL